MQLLRKGLMSNSTDHQPVMLKEAIEWLNIRPNAWYLDATLGLGGHTQVMLEAGGKVVAFDWDKSTCQTVREKLSQYLEDGSLLVINDNYAHLGERLTDLNQGLVDQIRGILFDLGTSVPQLTSSERGFSFQGDGPLDMRMAPDKQAVTAADLLAFMSQKQLTLVLREFGGEHQAAAIAKAIKNSKEPITTTGALAKLIESVKSRKGKLHPATKTFQALRIAVNSELDHLAAALPKALETLGPGGRLVVIAFHQGEDKLVKDAFREWAAAQKGSILTKKPLVPAQEEINSNPRSRSAKLRVFEKTV